MKYEYRCDKCNIIYIVDKKMNQALKEEECPRCHSTLKKVYSSPFTISDINSNSNCNSNSYFS